MKMIIIYFHNLSHHRLEIMDVIYRVTTSSVWYNIMVGNFLGV